MQRLVGNRAVAAAMREVPPVQRKGDMFARLRSLRHANRNAGAPAKKDTRVDDATGAVSTGAGLAKEPLATAGSTLGNFSLETSKLGDLKEKDETKDEHDADKLKFGDGSSRTALSIGSSGTGMVTSGLGGIVDFADMVKLWKKSAGEEGKLDDGFMKALAIGKGAKGLSSTAAVGSHGTALVAKGVNAAGEGGKEVATGAAGVTAGLGALGSGADMIMSAAKLAQMGINGFRKGWSKGMAPEALTEFLNLLKSFLATGAGVVSAVGKFLDIAGKAAEFLNALPVVGAAVNIATQLLDILIQVIAFVKSLYRMVKSHKKAKAMKRMAAHITGTDKRSQDEKQMLLNLATINMKRLKRAVLPLVTSVVKGVADLISIAGSVLNIVGVATAAAYGAGVGLMAGGYAASATAGLMKAGAAAAKPIQTLIRKGKQRGRDVGARKPTSLAAKLFNTAKSTDKKQAQYVEDAKAIVRMIVALPPDPQELNQQLHYQRAYAILKATGIETKKLFAEADTTKQFHMLIAAMKTRE